MVDDLVPTAACDRLAAGLAEPTPSSPRRRGGRRDLLRIAVVRDLAGSAWLRSLVDLALSPAAFAVRALLFDKVPESNWSVSWHQDMTIAVTQRVPVPGFGPWSTKAGIPHVRPPVAILERMVAVRVHLDPCGPDDGALAVIPGSHRRGLSGERPGAPEPLPCPVGRGGALVLSPLLWHSSARSARPRHRRVIHLEYADVELPDPLEWHDRW